jgi:hypothetical protein
MSVDYMDSSKRRMNAYSDDQSQAQSENYFNDNFIVNTQKSKD